EAAGKTGFEPGFQESAGRPGLEGEGGPAGEQAQRPQAPVEIGEIEVAGATLRSAPVPGGTGEARELQFLRRKPRVRDPRREVDEEPGEERREAGGHQRTGRGHGVSVPASGSN